MEFFSSRFHPAGAVSAQFSALSSVVLDLTPRYRMPNLPPLAALHRLAAVTLLGFASGLPLALTGQEIGRAHV